MPDVNLVPMMDVIMTILTFFIIVSMTLSNQKALNVPLPRTDQGGTEIKQPDPLIVGLNVQGQILLDGKPATDSDLAQKMQAYLTRNVNGAVILKADRKVPYEQVAKLLSTMQALGGERVSLAITAN
ncbi:MAG: biopolymer transporter ExbD [Scytolyngbya sp. HA4215-MV1]|nr:biopolymer transporter ExbD [Scytolyngbya sp. HA4215-MV1]